MNLTMDADVLERDIKLPKQPLFSLRRLVIVTILLVVSGLLVWGFRGTGEAGGNDRDDAIVLLIPNRNDRVLRQAEVGAELKQGYDGRISIDGVEIPEEQMEGALTPEARAELSPTELGKGVRPNNKNSVRFKPGPGKAVSRLETGAIDLQLRYWPVEDGPDNAKIFTWTIYVN
jgi:hypothetical protein